MPALQELNPNTMPLSKYSSSGTLKAPPSSSKRPRGKDAVDTPEESDDDDVHVYKWDCNQIRTKINALVRSGEMKVTEFQRINDINSNSYGRFMKLKGPYAGSSNQTYYAGHKFFLKRERQGIKAPQPKKAKSEDVAKYDVTDIHFHRDDDQDLPIYDTCDDLRTKIQAHLRLPGITQAELLRQIGNMFTPPRKIQSKQLNDFLSYKGPTHGSTSSLYWSGYVYFEKLRIKNGAQKTKKRKEVEKAQPNGMPKVRPNTRFIVPIGSDVIEDQFGRMKTIGWESCRVGPLSGR